MEDLNEGNKSERVDGHDFLAHLREASGLTDFDGPTEATLRIRNSTQEKLAAPLKSLFEAEAIQTSSPVINFGSLEGRADDTIAKPPLATKKPLPTTHKSSVSWSAETLPKNMNQRTYPSDILTPELGRNSSIDGKLVDTWLSQGNQPTISREHLPRPRLNSAASTGSAAYRLKLDQVSQATPFEQEAETHLLKAIEDQEIERESGHHSRSRTFSSSNFIDAPDSIHDFVADSPVKESPTRRLEDVMQSDHRRSPSPVLERERVPLVEERPTVHRRSLSVEQTLFNISTAMSAIHKNEQDPLVMPPIDDGVHGSADILGHNAVLLTQSQKPTEKGSHLPTVMELPVNQETDDLNEGGDIEQGNETSHVLDSLTPSSRRRKVEVEKFREDVQMWRNFFQMNQGTCLTYIKNLCLYLIFPATSIAAILFYFFENPTTGDVDADGAKSSVASASWWLLFACVRQATTFSMAIATQALLIDFIALRTRWILKLTGPVLTLLIVQSKGPPFIFFFWSIYDFGMLFGDRPFAHHWAFWQDSVGLFNEANPSGNVVNAEWYWKVLIVTCTISIVAALKRFLIGLYLGRQTFIHYGKPLAKVMKKMLLMAEVAALAKSMESNVTLECRVSNSDPFNLHGLAMSAADSEDERSLKSAGSSARTRKDVVTDTGVIPPVIDTLQTSDRMKLLQLIDHWEEPDREFNQQRDSATISAVLSFRKALLFIQRRYPFSYSFGPAQTREDCIESAKQVYLRMSNAESSDDGVLHFDTIARLAMEHNELNQEKARALLKLFRPDREGRLTLLDFVRSVDAVYKDFRLLTAAIENANSIDRSFENIFNIFFYLLVSSIVLSRLGFDPLALFLSLSSIILAFAFAIGSAAAKYIEGVLLILVRRPYNIGDRINIAGVEATSPEGGSAGWIVEHVTLFETTVIFGATNERASIPNGAMANSRIINMARSPQAQLILHFKIPISTSFNKITLFKSAVEEYMKSRPREWLALNGFHANRIEADQGWTEYKIIAQHRQSWQDMRRVYDSKADLNSYCQEVLQQLGVNYRAPPLPVDLQYLPQQIITDTDNSAANHGGLLPKDASEVDNQESLTKDFQSMAAERQSVFLNGQQQRTSYRS